MKKTIAVAVLLMLCLYSKAQTGIQPLTPGDTVPDVALQLVNYPKQKARLYNFTGKLLILEFWSPLCSGCAHKIALPDSLQRQFKNSICILPVSSVQTGMGAGNIQQFIKGYKQRIPGGFTLPSVVEDSILAALFPFTAVPDLVWIYKGKYILRTEADALTPGNINAILNGNTTAVSSRRDRLYYSMDTFLKDFITGNPAVQQVYAHLYKGEIEALQPGSGFVRDTINGNRITAVNSSALDLYALAFNAPVPLYKNRIVNQTGNKDLFAPGGKSSTELYSYEFTAQAGMEALQKQMQRDLCSYFKTDGAVQKQLMHCYVLKAKDTGILRSNNKIAGNSLYENISGKRVIYNQSIGMFAERLNQLLVIPVLDETGIVHRIDLELPNNLTDITALQQKLESQGIQFIKTERMIDVLILMPATTCPGTKNTTFNKNCNP